MRFVAVPLPAAVLLFCLSGCQGKEALGGSGNPPVFGGAASNNSYFLSGSAEDRNALKDFFTLLAAETESSREQLAIIREIANTYIKQREFNRLINFLGGRIHRYPENPYNTYYRFMIAFAHQQLEAHPAAALQFAIILKNHPDLEIQGSSIHLAALNQLIALTDDPYQRVQYYEELISRFLDQIDPGPVFFMLGQAYEAIGEWQNAIRAYTRFLSYPPSNIPGFPNAESYARRLVNFNNSAKDWTFASLDSLERAVKAALDAGSSSRLWQYHAKTNFFTRTWEHDDAAFGGVAGHLVFNLADFMRGNRIRYADSLVVSSTASEAYLRTVGWSQHISTWYLYFRKVHFPPDPAIHGRWEWAGIYYGERF